MAQIRTHFGSLLELSTAANGEAMRSSLTTPPHPTIVAVDVQFVRDFGINLLKRSETRGAPFSILIFGLENRYDDTVASLYRLSHYIPVVGYCPQALEAAIKEAADQAAHAT